MMLCVINVITYSTLCLTWKIITEIQHCRCRKGKNGKNSQYEEKERKKWNKLSTCCLLCKKKKKILTSKKKGQNSNIEDKIRGEREYNYSIDPLKQGMSITVPLRL